MKNIPILFLIFVLGCVEESTQTPDDICYQAALHREQCSGEFITPPECTDVVLAQSKELLATPCDQMDETFSKTGKADGAFCDWFGLGCTADEPIFIGAACQENSECESGFCVENHCFDGVTSNAFETTLDLFTTSKLDLGSNTDLLVDAARTRQFRNELVRSAQSFIHFSTYILEDDQVAQEMIELFIEALERGVEVRVIVDATVQWTLSDYSLLETLAEAGVEVIVFNPIVEWDFVRLGTPMTINDRLHEKILVVDGDKAIIGGRNIGDNYLLEDRWRDTDVYIEGPGAAGVNEIFMTDWKRISEFEFEAGCPNQTKYGFACPIIDLREDAKYSPDLPVVGPATTRAIFSNPHTQDTPEGYFTHLALVRAAKKSITIANAYFVPPRRLRRHLKAAVKRGVKVKVLTNSKTSTDATTMYYASINFYRELIGAGIEIHQYKGSQAMHAKTMLIDDEVALVGSFNLDPRSAIDNSEAMVLIQDGEAVQQLRSAMDSDFAYSDLASADISNAELLKARAARLIEPLL